MTSKEEILYCNDTVDDVLVKEQLNLIVGTNRLPFKEDITFIKYARENSWQKRRENENPWPWKTDVFEFIREIYGPWLGKGLVQADLRAVDRPLYAEFHKRLSALPESERERILSKLKLPTASEARLAEIEDPVERAQREAVRAWWRAQWRAQKTAGPRP